MNISRLEIPAKLVPVFEGVADVRGSYGGRGSAKTRTFAKMTAVRALMWSQAGEEGIILCGRQFMNSLADSSLEEIRAGIESEPWLRPYFELGEKYIRTLDGRINYAFTGLDRNINSIKSKARIKLAWIDEAEPVTDEAWTKLIPTLRTEDSELWITWNPERKKSATNIRFMGSNDPLTKIVEMNWRDNPWFPAILDRARLKDQLERPDQYDHIWEGAYLKIYKGAYFADGLSKATREGRIGIVAADPLLALRAYWDIGGTGEKADATAIWIVQFAGLQVRVLAYYEAIGQELKDHVHWLRDSGYERAECRLPHDGASHEKVVRMTYASALRDAGFSVTVNPDKETGIAMRRIEAVRRLFPQFWFNEKTTEAGLEALGAYHEKWDDKRDVGQGPEHDWASHAADAFGLMALDYEAPRAARKIQYSNRGIV